MGSVIFSLFFLLCFSLAAQTLPGQPMGESYSVPPVDAPELAPRGAFGVGVRTVDVIHPGQPDILRFDKATGKAPLNDRPLRLEVWYPAVIPAGASDRTSYELAMPRSGGNAGGPKMFRIPGKALRDAAAVTGTRFPLVIVSHGYPGSRYFMSYLTENLASKGYVVIAIDHTDSVFGAEGQFSSTLYNRRNDQSFAIDAAAKMDFLKDSVDLARVAVVGYSMGGYGALASAGAGYSAQSMPVTMVPGGYMKDELTAGSEKFIASQRKEIKAVVAIAPWGGQPPMNSWTAEGLAGIRIPALFIAGDQDDVSGYLQGIKPTFERAVNSERCMLVYQNARHNVGGNPRPDDPSIDSYMTREFFDEPVWRKDRIGAINQHFITAFLDLNLKGDESKRAYLKVATEKSNDGKWPAAPGQPSGAKFSDGATFWKGFQRRWALGLELHCAAPAVR